MVCIVAAIVVTISLAFRVADRAKALGSNYVLKGSNHPIIYVLVTLVFYVSPLYGLSQFTSDRLWTMVWVRGDVMFPTLVEGDLLLKREIHGTTAFESSVNVKSRSRSRMV